jgi:phenylpropionate dioxygenase-like ring-hydroxylating dioxygenase large terminal subunit
MVNYTDNPNAAADLVQRNQVHRDVYINQEVYALEMKHVFANAWIFVGHESQTPEKGDYFATQIGNQPVIQVRHKPDDIHVLYNRCPHKGTKIVIDRQGNTGKFFRCPYHAWSFKTDGCLLAIPLKKGYEGTGLEETDSGKGMKAVGAVHNYRGFIFARLAEEGISFEEFFGDSLSSLDNMVDRSPVGRLEVVGPPLRYLHHCNYKMLVENQTDTCHPMVAHESSAGTAVKLYEELNLPEGSPKPAAMEIIAPFMSAYEFFEDMGIRTWPNGHGHTGVHHSIHSDYSAVPGYVDAMTEAYGADKAQAILDDNRHNTVYFPNIMIKGPIQQLRNFIPLAADRTIVESYIYRLVGAPDELTARTAMYNRMINAPTSIVGHDDLEMYERAQEGLHVDGMQWVNVQRLLEDDEDFTEEAVLNGTTERQMRNQFNAWRKFMLYDTPQQEAAE